MARFVVVTPSRGLIHSRTVAAVLSNIAQAEASGHVGRGWCLSHDLPIPDAHEHVAAAGLTTGADALWFVEEDVVPPSGALLHLLGCPEDVALVDYPVGEGPTQSCTYHIGGSVAWFGLGCTLIRRAVFETLARPWFRIDRSFSVGRDGRLQELAGARTWGGQDVWFSRQAIAAGFAVGETGLLAAHARLRALGPGGRNAGTHRIDILDAVGRWN